MNGLLCYFVQGFYAFSRYSPGILRCHSVSAFEFMVNGIFIRVYHGNIEE